MNNSYSQINLDDVEDMYARYGMQEHGESRYLREDVGAETIGLSLYRLKAGKRTGFAHRHRDVEEMYVVLAGSGRMKVDDDILELRERDVVRVAPQSVREFEGGPDGLELLATGSHAAGDGETIENWWT
jgi:mannose-6-phosphate isomerase-like protein (cupin superfamily)